VFGFELLVADEIAGFEAGIFVSPKPDRIWMKTVFSRELRRLPGGWQLGGLAAAMELTQSAERS
jgi:hypothetical protein